MDDGFKSNFIIYTGDYSLVEQICGAKDYREYHTKICEDNIKMIWSCFYYLMDKDCKIAIRMADSADKAWRRINSTFYMYFL